MELIMKANAIFECSKKRIYLYFLKELILALEMLLFAKIFLFCDKIE